MRRTDRLIGAALERPIADILYLPYLGGERAPFSDPYARAAFIGMNRNAERADMCRAALEGVAYAYAHALDALHGMVSAFRRCTRSARFHRRGCRERRRSWGAAGSPLRLGLAEELCTGGLLPNPCHPHAKPRFGAPLRAKIRC